MNHIREIDNLRGIAILLTLTAHLAFHQPVVSDGYLYIIQNFAQFWGGVYLFLVISGYVISRGFSSAFSTANAPEGIEFRATWKAFYLRRFFRIVPTATIWIVITFLLGTFANSHGNFGSTESLVKQALAAFFFVYNAFVPWIGGAAFGIYWSLSFEEQFYLLFPFLCRSSLKARTNLLVVIIAGFSFIHRPADQSLIMVSFPVDAIAWGILISILRGKEFSQNWEPKFLKSISFRYANLLISILWLVLTPVQFKDYTFGTSLMILPAAWIVYCASFNKGYVDIEGPLGFLLCKFGVVSFSLYCCHMSAFLLTKELFLSLAEKFGPGIFSSVYISFVFAMLVSILFTMISFRLVESPTRSFAKKFSMPRVTEVKFREKVVL